MNEIERIRSVYKARKVQSSSPYSLLFAQQREREIKRAIRTEGIDTRAGKKVLDIGCGSGTVLACFLRDGIAEEGLYGIDLMPERIERARGLYPRANFICCNAEKLPYADEFFDIITQATVFTSILDSKMKQQIAREMLRVLSPNGLIVWHDYRFNNPFNRHVRGIGRTEIMRLFPNCRFGFKLMNLNPLLARPLARISWDACRLLELIPILRTHWLVTVRKSASFQGCRREEV